MSSTMKKIFLCIIGILAGIAAWPFSETALLFQSYFPSFLIFSIFVGGIFGFFMGAFFSSSEGIFLAQKSKIAKGMLTGAVVGVFGGIIGFLVGQAILFILGEYLLHSSKDFNKIGLPLSRSIAWSTLGVFIGITEGVRARSFKKISIGFIGGFLGGAVGGLISEILKPYVSNIVIARLAGLAIFGFFIGLFYGFVEKKLSYGILRLLNGKYKGKEFLINQKKLRIGNSSTNEIALPDYENIGEYHAELYMKQDDIYIKNSDSKNPVRVNDEKINEYRLKFNDVVKIGNAKFLYKYC